MALKAYFQDRQTPSTGAPMAPGVLVWHLAWSAVMLLALVGLLLLPAGVLTIGAIVAMTLPGPAAIVLLSRDSAAMRQALVVVWAVCALSAVALTGGISGPLAAWAAAPVIAAVALNQRRLISLGATLSCGLTLLAAVESMFDRVRIPDSQEGFWLSLIAVSTAVVGLSVALLPALRARVERANDAEDARARLLKVLTEQPQLVLSLDDSGRVVAAYGEAPAGLDLNLLMQAGLSTAVHAPDRSVVKAALDQAIAQGRAEVGFRPHAAMDHFLHLNLRRGSDGRLYGALSDATLAHAREASLEQGRAEAEQLNLSKSRFLANMSHELRTPLNAVIGFSDIMRQQMFGDLTARYAEYAQLIWESGQHVLDMINDVLDMSKIEAQKYQLTLETFDIREPVSQALRLMRAAAHEKGIEVAGALPQGPLEVTADRRAIKQICLNLLSNAIKFTPAGGHVALALGQDTAGVSIAITDTGIGIAPDDLSRMGQPYEQSGSADQKAMGTGLGLSLVKALAHLHGGDMTLDSRQGEGTQVTVRMPVALHASDGDEPRLPLPEPEPRPMARSAPINPLEDYTQTPETLAAFSDFVIRPPKS